MSGIPGTLANQWTWNPSPNNGCRMNIRCRGQGSYVLVANVPVQEAQLKWFYRGNSGIGTKFQRSGRPKANIMVWHLDRNKVAEYFEIEFRVAMPKHVGQIQCQLYTVPMGGAMPRGPGWMPEDIQAHVH